MGSEVGAGGSRCSGLAAARAVQVWSAAEENWCRVRLCAPWPGMLLCAARQCRRGTYVVRVVWGLGFCPPPFFISEFGVRFILHA